MLSGVAHELNNPLASVLGFSQLAASTAPGAALTKRLGMIHDEARRCQKIVQNLLRFARRHEPQTAALALNEIVESTGALVSYQLRVDGISLVLDLDRNLPPVLGDAHELQQALVNLVTNAHQAIRAAGRGGTIVVRTVAPPGADRVILEVADDGPGVPQEIRSRIFDPFFTTKPAGVGTGLGLALVYATIAAHGPHSVALLGSPRASLEANVLLRTLAEELGTPHLAFAANSEQDRAARLAVSHLETNARSLAEVRPQKSFGCSVITDGPG